MPLLKNGSADALAGHNIGTTSASARNDFNMVLVLLWLKGPGRRRFSVATGEPTTPRIGPSGGHAVHWRLRLFCPLPPFRAFFVFAQTFFVRARRCAHRLQYSPGRPPPLRVRRRWHLQERRVEKKAHTH